MDYLQKQLKYLKDNLKKCLDRRAKVTKSGAPASSLPKCSYFETMRFLHDRTANLPTESNVQLDSQIDVINAAPKDVCTDFNKTPLQQKQSIKRKINESARVNQAQTEAALISQLKKVDDALQEQDYCEDSLYCKSLIPIMRQLPLKKKRLAKIKISQMLYDIEFNDEALH